MRQNMRYCEIAEINKKFAITLLAARHCFYYSKRLKAFMRISWLDEEKELFQVEICPTNKMRQAVNYHSGIAGLIKGRKYFLWQETPELEENVSSSLYTPYKTFLDYEVLTVNGNGELIQ